jgi:hypothetical protein
MRSIVFTFAALFALFALPAAAAPLGAECTGDADCDAGLFCGEERATPCAVAPCAPGEECPPPESCEAEGVRYCEPSPCASDDECGETLVCKTFTWESCSATPACPPNEPCEVPPDSGECTSGSASFCVPSWVGPCEIDTDCGDGFLCVAGEICGCSVSSGGEESCSCEESGDRWCQPEPVVCAGAGDCQEGWDCVETAVPCSDQGCEPSESLCAPPGYDTYAPIASGALEDAAENQARGTTTPSGATEPTDDADGGCAAVPGSLLTILAALAIRARRARPRG